MYEFLTNKEKGKKNQVYLFYVHMNVIYKIPMR